MMVPLKEDIMTKKAWFLPLVCVLLISGWLAPAASASAAEFLEISSTCDAESGKATSYAELCSEYRKLVRNGKLACTRENDPIQGPDGKVHGNTCSMCEVFFQAEEEEKKKKEGKSRNGGSHHHHHH